MILVVFFQRFKLTKKHHFDDNADQCDGLIYEGSEHMITNEISTRTNSGCSNNSALYEIDKNVKYSLNCNNERVLYTKSPHYVWQLCNVA